jgi:hypothetical protein
MVVAQSRWSFVLGVIILILLIFALIHRPSRPAPLLQEAFGALQKTEGIHVRTKRRPRTLSGRSITFKFMTL